MMSDKDQKSVNAPQHKRLAMGVPLNGQSMESKQPVKQEAKLLKRK
jgi:hypothetical protein